MVYKGVRISEICYNFAAEINSIYMTEQILDYLIVNRQDSYSILQLQWWFVQRHPMG